MTLVASIRPSAWLFHAWASLQNIYSKRSSHCKQTQNRIDDVLQSAIERHDRIGELSIGFAQSVIALFILSLHLISSYRHNFETLSYLVVALLSVLILSSLIRAHLTKLAHFREVSFTALTIVDGCLLVGVIWAFSGAYDMPLESSLKSPTIGFLFAFIGLRALRFSCRAAALSGIVVVSAWIGGIALAHFLSSGLLVVTLYEDFLTTNALLVGAEIEKLFALVALALCIAIGARRGRQMVESIVRSQLDLKQLSRQDSLTGVSNSKFFNRRLERAMGRVARGEQCALLSLDLDRFKSINETLGHAVGDKVLKIIASRIQAQIREVDTLARHGGDEFIILQSGINCSGAAARLANRINELLREPIEVDGHQISTTASIGIALAPSDGTDAGKLVHCADLALCRAKADGRATYRFFEVAMDMQMQARRQMELDLRSALDSDQLQVNYQPLVDSQSSTVSGFEALVRWPHPTKGAVSPAHFIPLAEEVGMIGEIGNVVLRKACNDALSWPDTISVAVNISAEQFKDPQLFEAVQTILQDTGLPPHRLELEITETSLMQDTDQVAEVLAKLRDLGVKIALDDFGTGYSSLSHLQNFPFDKVKVDRSFVKRIATEENARAIVRAILHLSTELGLKTTAEGVEKLDQLKILQSEGVSEIQGYLYSEARPACQVLPLIDKISRGEEPTGAAA